MSSLDGNPALLIGAALVFANALQFAWLWSIGRGERAIDDGFGLAN